MKTTRHREAGNAVIELALIIPILLWLGMGVSELAGLLRIEQMLSNAAREAVRMSVLPEYQGNTAPAIARAKAYLSTENSVNCVSTPSIAVSQTVYIAQSNGVNITASQATVKCGRSLVMLPALSGGTIKSAITLTGTATMRNLY